MSTLIVLFHPNLSCLVTYVNGLIISHQASYDGLQTHCRELCPSCFLRKFLNDCCYSSALKHILSSDPYLHLHQCLIPPPPFPILPPPPPALATWLTPWSLRFLATAIALLAVPPMSTIYSQSAHLLEVFLGSVNEKCCLPYQ